MVLGHSLDLKLNHKKLQVAKLSYKKNVDLVTVWTSEFLWFMFFLPVHLQIFSPGGCVATLLTF